MPPRLNKRQLREQQELASLSTPNEVDSQDEPESGDQDAATWSQPGKQLSGFAAVRAAILFHNRRLMSLWRAKLGPEDSNSDSEEPGPSQAKQASRELLFAKQEGLNWCTM